MGDARRRGTFKERAEATIKRNKAQLAKNISDLDADNADLLRIGLGAFATDSRRTARLLELVAEQLEIDGVIRRRPDIDELVAESVRDS